MLKESTHFLDDVNQTGINLSSLIEPIFLCRWNGRHSIHGRSNHEIVEIHSKNTLLNKYSSTNLFDNDLINNDINTRPINGSYNYDLKDWIDTISNDDDFYNRPFINDNFEIERIK